MGARRAALGNTALRRSNTSAAGTGGTGCGRPTIGLSQSLARPARNSNIGAGSRSASVPSVCSYSHCAPCRVTDIAMSVSTESSACHDAGVIPSARYSNGAAPSAARPRVHAFGIGIEFGAVVGGCQGQRPRRDAAKAMHALGAVGVERRRPDEHRELAGGLASLQVHLEEAFLAVQEADRARQVDARRRRDRGNAEPVARDGHGRAEPGERQLPVERGQAPAHHHPRPDGHDDGRHRRQPSHPSEEAQHVTHAGILGQG